MKEPKLLEGIYPDQKTVLAAINAMQAEMSKPNRVEDHNVELRRLNALRRIYIKISGV